MARPSGSEARPDRSAEIRVTIRPLIHEIRVDPTEKKCYYYIKIIPDFQGGAGEEKALGNFGVDPHHQFLLQLD